MKNFCQKAKIKNKTRKRTVIVGSRWLDQTYHGNNENKFSIISRFIAIHNYDSEHSGFGKPFLNSVKKFKATFEIVKY